MNVYTPEDHVEWIDNSEAVIKEVFISTSDPSRTVYSIWPVYEENPVARFLVFDDEIKSL